MIRVDFDGLVTGSFHRFELQLELLGFRFSQIHLGVSVENPEFDAGTPFSPPDYP